MKTTNNTFLFLAITCLFAAAAHGLTDTSAPILNLKTPITNSRTNNATISGYCTEANLTHIWYQLFNTNGDVVTTSALADVAVTGTMELDPAISTKWIFSTAVTPLPGTNTLWIQAQDAGGRLSMAVMRRFFYQVGTPFTLNIEGDGTGKVVLGRKLNAVGGYSTLLTLNANGSGATVDTNLNLGEDYVLIATVGARSWFSNWTGVVTTSGNKIYFRGAPGLSATAHFDTNRFFVASGRPYYGLFREADAVRMESAGALRVSLSSLGNYTAQIRLNGQTNNFTGTLDHSGFATGTISRINVDKENGESTSETITLNLQMDFTNSAPSQCWVTISSSAGWSSAFDVWRYSTTFPGPLTAFNIVIPPGDDAPVESPAGYGFIRFSIPHLSSAVPTPYYVIGTQFWLCDDTYVSYSPEITPNGTVPICCPLYHDSSGLLWGSIDLTANPPGGQLTWIKKRPPSGQYPHGFTNDITAAGSTFIPGSTITLLSDPATLTFKEGDLTEPLDFSVSMQPLATGAKLTNAAVAPPNTLYAFLNASVGTMGGFFRETTNNSSSTTTFRGVFLQNSNTAYGYWIGKNGSSGSVDLHY